MENTKLVSPPEARYTVYKLTDPEGKVYIGCTGTSVEQRWCKGRGYRVNVPIRRAIDRFGWDAFDKQILCEKLIREGAEKLEKWFIAYYDSSDPEKGYNRFLGGLGKGAQMSEITKKISSESKKRLYEEHPELKERIRNSVNSLFENDPDYRERVRKAVLQAYERDPSIKIRLSEISRKLWQDPDYRARSTEGRAAVCVGNTELAAVLQERGRQYHREHPEIGAAASAFMSAYLHSSAGRKFVESDNTPRPVRCVETGEVYPSQRAAEKATGFCSIHKVCAGRKRTCGGYHWEYVEKKV
ncbi:MAG: hypothetical protein IJK38_10440 [Oscillospiraceae bacterium]|nr:hypothetical protein [Oscillospiraceae bacterium]